MITLITLIIVAALLYGLVYALTVYLPMPPGWARLIQGVVIVLIILWLLSYFVPFPDPLFPRR